MKRIDVSCELWSINKWLRWTGFRLYINVDREALINPDHKPSRVGIRFFGWRDLP